MHPPRADNMAALDYFGSEVLGLSGFVAYLLTIILACIVMFRSSRIYQFFDAIVIGVFITAAWPIWFYLIDVMISVGDILSEKADFYDAEGGSRSWLSMGVASDNPLIVAAAFAPTAFLGGCMLVVVFAYELYNLAVKYGGLLIVAFRPLSDKNGALCDGMIGAAFVTMIFGRPLMILCLDIAEMLGDTELGDSSLGVVIMTMTGFIAGLWLQSRLFKFTYRQTVKMTGGRGSFTQRVKGNVDATVNNRGKVDANNVNQSRVSAKQPSQVSKLTEEGKSRIRKKVLDKTGTALKVGAVAATGGTSAAAGTAVASKVQASKSPPSKQASPPATNGAAKPIHTPVEPKQPELPVTHSIPGREKTQPLPPTHKPGR